MTDIAPPQHGDTPLGTAPSNGLTQTRNPLNIDSKYIQSAQNSIVFPLVLNKSDIDEIKKFKDLKFWSKVYGGAKASQSSQIQILFKLYDEEKVRQNDKNAFQEPMDKIVEGATKKARDLLIEFNQEVEKLGKLNKEISLRNQEAGLAKDFGHVRTHTLLQPKLKVQDDFEVITQHPILQQTLAKPYFQALQLQHYRNDYLNAIDNSTGSLEYDHLRETAIIAKLSQINSTIKASLKGHIKRLKLGKQDFGFIHVPDQGDELLDFEDLDYEVEIEGFSDIAAKEGMFTDPNDKPHIEEEEEILEIRTKMGGRQGPLARYIMAFNAGNQGPNEIEELQNIQDEVDALCITKQIPTHHYALTDTTIKAFAEMVNAATEGLQALKSDESNTQLQAQYTDLRGRAQLFVEEQRWPIEFVDTFVPPEHEALSLARNMPERRPKSKSSKKKPKTHDKIPEELPPLEEKARAPKSKSSKKRPKTQVEILKNLPPIEDTEDQCISTGLMPGVIVEMDGDETRYKRVTGFRKQGVSTLLMLKSKGTNPKFANRYIFELVYSTEYRSALKDFQRTHGDRPLLVGKDTDIKDRSWSQAKIGGVASVRRNESKYYLRQAITLIMVKFPSEGFLWISKSILFKEFGNEAEKKINQYRVEAGQELPKPPQRLAWLQIQTSKEKTRLKIEKAQRKADEEMVKNKATKKKAAKTRTDIEDEETEDEESEDEDTEDEDTEDEVSEDEESEDEETDDEVIKKAAKKKASKQKASKKKASKEKASKKASKEKASKKKRVRVVEETEEETDSENSESEDSESEDDIYESSFINDSDDDQANIVRLASENKRLRQALASKSKKKNRGMKERSYRK